jgi:hypothetical protein
LTDVHMKMISEFLVTNPPLKKLVLS